MAFPESLKVKIRRKCHMCCCLCRTIGVEIHHILPQEEGGPDSEDNAAPLCPTCHEIYGANPSKRKFIREARDLWYEICESRYSDLGVIEEVRNNIKHVATETGLNNAKNELLRQICAIGSSEAQRNGFDFLFDNASLRVLFHEISSSLSGINAATSFIKRDLEKQGAALQHEFVEDILRYHRRITKTIRLFEIGASRNRFARIYPEPTPIDSVVESALQTLKPLMDQREIDKSQIVHKNLHRFPLLTLDRGLIALAVEQLIENAIRYATSAIEFQLTISAEESRYIHTLVFTDFGVGIGEDERDLVFDPGYRSAVARALSPGRLGLGLWSARECMARHGGKLILKSPAKPTQFQMVFPSV